MENNLVNVELIEQLSKYRDDVKTLYSIDVDSLKKDLDAVENKLKSFDEIKESHKKRITDIYDNIYKEKQEKENIVANIVNDNKLKSKKENCNIASLGTFVFCVFFAIIAIMCACQKVYIPTILCGTLSLFSAPSAIIFMIARHKIDIKQEINQQNIEKKNQIDKKIKELQQERLNIISQGYVNVEKESVIKEYNNTLKQLQQISTEYDKALAAVDDFENKVKLPKILYRNVDMLNKVIDELENGYALTLQDSLLHIKEQLEQEKKDIEVSKQFKEYLELQEKKLQQEKELAEKSQKSQEALNAMAGFYVGTSLWK